VAEGVAHAPVASVTAADSRADCDTGGKERRPSTRAKLLIVRNIAKREMRSRSRDPPVGQTKYAIVAGGPLLPGLWSPRFFFALGDSKAFRRERTRVT
jgi:hypothetical protein